MSLHEARLRSLEDKTYRLKDEATAIEEKFESEDEKDVKRSRIIKKKSNKNHEK